jgi:ABC-2 type transport system permease protein
MQAIAPTTTQRIVVPDPPSTLAERVRWAVTDGLTIARRNLSHIRRVPERLMGVTVQPIVFVVLFGYVFGSAIKVPGANYREFLMPGMFAMTMFGTIGSTAVGFAQDMSTGIIDRFRSLPMSRLAVMLGRSLSDLFEGLLGLAVIVACGIVVGWRPHGSMTDIVGAFALLLLIAFAMNWAGLFVGLSVRTPEVAQQVMFLIFLPITFLANTFVPTAGMSPVLRTIADWNPMSSFVAASRQLLGSPSVPSSAWPMLHPVVASLFWVVVILAIFVPLGLRRYQNATRT